MTNEEAIKFLSQIMDVLLASNSWLPSTDNPIKESFGMAIDALKKQIPVKPVKSKEERCGMGYVYHDWVCPSCGRFLAPEPAQTGNHHCKCGQAIDWEGN